MAEKVIAQVNLEIAQIDELFKSYSNLLDKIRIEKPDLIEITASASILHSFYNGLENIFLCIAKRIDGKVPTGDRWHRDLLDQIQNTTSKRTQVLSAQIIDHLIDYMGFRHFYRHSYSFQLEWEELAKLILPMQDLWKKIKNELQTFLDSLRLKNEENQISIEHE